MTSTYTDLSTASAIGDQLTADHISQLGDNDDYNRNPPHLYYAHSTGAADITTTSTSFVTITGFTGNITTQGNPIQIEFWGRINTANTRFDIEVDSVSITADNEGLGSVAAISTFGNVYFKRIVAVNAGVHQVDILWKVSSGTATLYSEGLAQMQVREIGDLS